MIGYINGKQVEFQANETILTVAKRTGHFIPTLCEMADIHHTPGTCRVCLVDLQLAGATDHQIVTSCTTPMAEGAVILTRTPKVRQMQRLQVGTAPGRPQPGLCILHPARQLRTPGCGPSSWGSSRPGTTIRTFTNSGQGTIPPLPLPGT